MSEKIPAYVVHLDRDTQRAENVHKFIENTDLDTAVVSGVYGAELPWVARALIACNEGWAARSGEIGCFLSHMKVWERIAKSSSVYSIILEDDAICVNINRFNDIEISPEIDMVFLNVRMAISPDLDDAFSIPKCTDVLDGLSNLTKDGKLVRRDIGAYGYALSPRGAQRLLSAVGADGCYGHVDWRLIRYCVKEEQIIDRFGNDDELTHVLLRHHNPRRAPAWNVLTACCLDRPLVVHNNTLDSSRVRESNSSATS
jgi:GR25 family glycosyltransferase involved in LPS biosynthesis